MRRHSRGVVFALLVFVATTAFASSTPAVAGTTSAQISTILIYEAGDLVYVYPIGGVQGPPPCHGSNGNYYSFSLSRPRAKEYLAALLAAQARGALVHLWGTGACTDQSMSETLHYFAVVS
jgi:hypothetical protein